jgi:hypothetical protein
MRIKEIKAIEECLDSTAIKDIYLEDAISEEFMNYLTKYGELEYYRNFLRPFFKIGRHSKIQIKGIIGHNIITVLFKQYDKLSEELLLKYINSF